MPSKEIEPGLVRLNEGIALTLREFRQEAGLSQSDLASMVGVNQSLISRLERQECDGYSLSTLFRIFDKMNRDIEIRFIEREAKPTSEPPNSQ